MMGNETTVDDRIVEQVRDFIDGDDTKQRIIEDIVEFEEEHPGANSVMDDRDGYTDTAWETGKDVSMKPAYIGQIKNAPFINVVMDTNSCNILALKDRESTKHALQKEIDEPEKFTQEWADRKVKKDTGLFGGNLDDIEIKEDDRDKIESIVDDTDALDYWSEFVVPELKYRTMAKRAILIMLASPEDKHGNKGRVNVKIFGPGGTGKSIVKKWLRDNFGAVTIDGFKVTKAELTYNLNTEEEGLLPKAHKGIIVVEEADEMDEECVGATLTSLGESGEVDVGDFTLPAETRGVMLSNFSTRREIIMEWSHESVNRFDFMIKFDFLTDEEKDDTLDWHYKYFRKPKPGEEDDLFKKYIKMARSFDPEIEEHEKIASFRKDNIKKIENVREGLSLMNIAWTIARLNFEDVKLEHYKSAFELVTSQTSSTPRY